jgi:glyoxylase-like metal-dependent hydrolase (beta-lactamase superfamily II)
MPLHDPICVTCGTQYSADGSPRDHCPICDDDRQYVGPAGQEWTTLAEMHETHRNMVTDVEPGLAGIITEPSFAIGQRAHLITTPNGNLLWDCVSHLDEETVAEVERRGGIAAIALSHPHFHSSMVDWSRAFGDVPIYIHADNEPWVMQPDPAVRFWSDEAFSPLPDLTLVRCGGHFPGSSVLHWPAGAEGRGALLTGDTIYVVADRRWVSFMYSYPNLIPLDAAAVRRIVDAVEPLAFDRLYAAWPDRVVTHDATGAVHRSAERYLSRMAGRPRSGPSPRRRCLPVPPMLRSGPPDYR